VLKVTRVSASNKISILEALKELWKYKELIWAFSIRDIRVKYFQTILGPLWLLITPIITVGVMSFVFGLMVKIPSDNLPYLLFYLLSIIPWQTFIAVLNQTTSCLESHAGLLSKIYFPRGVLGLSYAINSSIDFSVGLTLIILFSIFFKVFTFKILLVAPLLLLIQMCFAIGLGFLLAPLNAQYRDIKHALPFFTQLFYFACPILYPVSLAPAWSKWMYNINPIAVVIASYRSVFSGSPLCLELIFMASIISGLVLLAGLNVFLKKERSMVDIL
jgi:lipopolysaccharide transport system permease protein